LRVLSLGSYATVKKHPVRLAVCLDHMIVFGEVHLRRILGNYAAYYNGSRIHRSLNKDAPFHWAIERVGAITHHGQSSAAFITNIAETDFRHAQPQTPAQDLLTPVFECQKWVH